MKRNSIFITALLTIFVCLAGVQAGGPTTSAGTPMTSSMTFKTSIGTLHGRYTLEDGAEIAFTGNKGVEVVFGFVSIAKGDALPVGVAIDVCTTRSDTKKSRITLVQDKKTGKWLATDGRVGLLKGKRDSEPVVFEGHTIIIIGGSKKPIKISGVPFSDTTVIIKGGKPVRQK